MKKLSTKGVSSDVQDAIAIGGGVFPLQGRYTAKAWGVLLGVSSARIRDYVIKLDIPYRQPGGEMFIDAVDFWDSLPVQRMGVKS